MLDKVKKLKKLRNQANKLQDALAKEEITVEAGNIKIVIGGDQKLKAITVDEQENKNLVDAINKAIKKSQKVAAKKMQELGGLGNLGI